MRTVIDVKMMFGQTVINNVVVLDVKSHDETAQMLRGLQHIYTDTPLIIRQEYCQYRLKQTQ